MTELRSVRAREIEAARLDMDKTARVAELRRRLRYEDPETDSMLICPHDDDGGYCIAPCAFGCKIAVCEGCSERRTDLYAVEVETETGWLACAWCAGCIDDAKHEGRRVREVEDYYL